MKRRRSLWIAVPVLVVPLLLFVVAFGAAAVFPSSDVLPASNDVAAASQVPRYINGNQLVRPVDYRRWIFVGASLGLSYAPNAAPASASASTSAPAAASASVSASASASGSGAAPGASGTSAAPARPQLFHHTYLAPRAYDEYLRTGEFPDKTMLVLELHQAGEKVAPATGGLFEGKRTAVEVAVKDRERFPDRGWAYFSFGDGSTDAVEAFPASAGCVTCHRNHAAHDNVFTQFYPVLRDRQIERSAGK
jgi:hypothetical protein